jgi:PPOX class probable F420-dependent enzyme
MGAIDTSVEPGARAEKRLRIERTVWLCTVSGGGAPSARPVWFLWDGETFLLFSQPGAAKVRHIAANPHVCLHLDPDEWGENVVIVTGHARVAPDHPPADQTAAFVEKYGWGFDRFGFTPSEYAGDYSTPILVEFERLRTYY